MKATSIQLVTQLETAGAQTLAHWIQSHCTPGIPVVFGYQKSATDLFPDPSLLSQNKPSTFKDALEFVGALLDIRKAGYQQIVAHTHYAIAIAWLLTRGTSTKVLPVHHWPIHRYPMAARIVLRIARFTKAFTDEVFVSDSIKDLPAAKVIPNPVPACGPYRELVNTPVDLLIVARHAPEKDIPTAIHALKILKGRTLTLVGGGEDTQELQDLVHTLGLNDRVTFTGRLSNPEVRALLKRANLVLLPSLWEAMPIGLLEAVAEDTPMAISRIPAHDFLLHAGAALGFDIENARDLARAVEEADSGTSRRALSHGRNLIRAAQSEEKTIKLWNAALQGNP